MKYIRTKDGIYNAIQEFKIGDMINVPYNGLIKIINQANTIEELCDEAVFFDKDNKPHYESQEGNIWYLGASLFTETLRFGIFTDKGLIYVAKMNDEGELELL